jgi:hypothetical protein
VSDHLKKLIDPKDTLPDKSADTSAFEAIKVLGNLYFIDYRDLEPYEYPVVTNGMYTHAPVILISDQLRAGNESLKLPLGIRYNVPKVLSPF